MNCKECKFCEDCNQVEKGYNPLCRLHRLDILYLCESEGKSAEIAVREFYEGKRDCYYDNPLHENPSVSKHYKGETSVPLSFEIFEVHPALNSTVNPAKRKYCPAIRTSKNYPKWPLAMNLALCRIHTDKGLGRI